MQAEAPGQILDAVELSVPHDLEHRSPGVAARAEAKKEAGVGFAELVVWNWTRPSSESVLGPGKVQVKVEVLTSWSMVCI